MRQESKQGLYQIENQRRLSENSMAKGKVAEDKACNALHLLKEIGVFSQVSKSSGKQDRSHGIDFFATVDLPETQVKIPFQIKSSSLAARAFWEKHKEDIIRKHIVTVVARVSNTREEVIEQILNGLKRHWPEIYNLKRLADLQGVVIDPQKSL